MLSKVSFILLLGVNAYCNTDYSIALSKAQEAFYIQSGLQHQVSEFQSYSEKECFKIIKNVGMEKESALILGGYKIYRDRGISFPMGNKKFTVKQDSVNITIGF